jgi:hypothetical protein
VQTHVINVQSAAVLPLPELAFETHALSHLKRRDQAPFDWLPALSGSLARRMVNIPDAKQANAILKEAMISLLNELKDLPQKVTDPNWLESLEQNGDAAAKRGN